MLEKRIGCLIIGAALLSSGCSTLKYNKKTSECLNYYKKPASNELALETREKALSHKAYDFIPFQLSQIKVGDPRIITWYMFGNEDDGIFGEGMADRYPYSTNINCKTLWKWNFERNFAHNFKYYPPFGSSCFSNHINYSLISIGRGKTRIFSKDKGQQKTSKFAFKLNLNDFKPFINLDIGSFSTYLGWREKGNFGSAIRISKKKKIKQSYDER